MPQADLDKYVETLQNHRCDAIPKNETGVKGISGIENFIQQFNIPFPYSIDGKAYVNI